MHQTTHCAMGASHNWTLAMQFQSCHTAFSAATVQAVSDMIYILFSIVWRIVFGKQNYSLTIIRYKNFTRLIPISKYGTVVNVSLGTLDMVHDSTPIKDSPAFWLSRLVVKYVVHFDCAHASVRLATYCSKVGHIGPVSTKAVNWKWVTTLL